MKSDNVFENAMNDLNKLDVKLAKIKKGDVEVRIINKINYEGLENMMKKMNRSRSSRRSCPRISSARSSSKRSKSHSSPKRRKVSKRICHGVPSVRVKKSGSGSFSRSRPHSRSRSVSSSGSAVGPFTVHRSVPKKHRTKRAYRRKNRSNRKRVSAKAHRNHIHSHKHSSIPHISSPPYKSTRKSLFVL